MGGAARVRGCSVRREAGTVPAEGRFAHVRRDETMPKHSGWQWWLVMSVSGLVACGNGARPANDGGSGSDGAATDVIRPPNSVYCPFFAGTDGGILRTDGLGHPINQPNADPILCHPDMRPGQPCRAYGNALGVCVDFEYESSGRFPWFTSNNRMALYCRTPDANPCDEVEITNGAVATSESCEEWGNVTVQPPPCVSLSPTLYQRNTDRNAMNTRPEGKPPAFARRSVAKRARRPPGLLDGVRSTTVEGSRFARWIDAFCVRS
jgi:hypothetical protein